MKNNTKIRLHLSKNLFESIAKEVLLEAKKANMSGGAYTEAVKMPPVPGQASNKPKMPPVPQSKASNSAPKIPAVPPLPAKKSDSSTPKIPALPKVPGQVKEVDAVGDTEKMRKMFEMSSKEKMAKGLYKEEEMEEMQVNVAEEDMLNEIDPALIDWQAVATGLGAIGLAPFLIDKIHNLWKKKFPKSFEKAQGLSGAMDRRVGGNEPGDKEGQVKTGKFESTKLNELRKKK